MKINPTSPHDPQRRIGAEHRPPVNHSTTGSQQDTSDVAFFPRTVPQGTSADSAKENARRVAEQIILQRTESGFYQRTEILSAVALRLMESGDLD
jgi:hypothetical protein